MLTGFSHSPISKGILIFLALNSLTFSISQSKYQLELDLIPHLLQYHQYWRLFVHQIAFNDSSQLFLSILILYRTSVTIERLFGSRKFAGFVLLQFLFQSSLLAILLPLIVLTPLSYALAYILPSILVEKGQLSPGPFGLVFSILFQYARLVPDSWNIRIGSRFWLGERWSVWILAILLFLSHPRETILPSLLGIIYSRIYSSKRSKFSKFQLSNSFHSLLSYLFTPLIGSTKLPPRSSLAEFPRNPTFQERREHISVERNAFERSRENGLGGRYGLNFIRRNRRNPNTNAEEPTLVINVTNENLGNQNRDGQGDGAGTGTGNGTLRRTRISTLFTGTGQASSWSLLSQQPPPPPPPPPRTDPNVSPEAILGGDSFANLSQPVSPTTARRFRNYLNQITGETATFNESTIFELQSMFPNLSRETIVRNLQISDGNQERAVERLLEFNQERVEMGSD